MPRASPLDRGIEHEKPTVERILRATLRCLAGTDSERLSMREIAAEAQVSKSLLHYHFRSKDELLLELVDRLFKDMIRRIEAVTDRLAAERGGVEALVGSLDAIWDELRAAKDLQAIILRVSARGTLDDGVRQRLMRFRTRVHKITAEGIRRALGPSAPEGLPLDDLAEIMLSGLIGFEASRLFAEDPGSLDRAFQLVKLGLAHLAGSLGTSGEGP